MRENFSSLPHRRPESASSSPTILVSRSATVNALLLRYYREIGDPAFVLAAHDLEVAAIAPIGADRILHQPVWGPVGLTEADDQGIGELRRRETIAVRIGNLALLVPAKPVAVKHHRNRLPRDRRRERHLIARRDSPHFGKLRKADWSAVFFAGPVASVIWIGRLGAQRMLLDILQRGCRVPAITSHRARRAATVNQLLLR